jgi:hypothetical protein
MANVRKSFDSYRLQYTSSNRPLPLASISCFQGTTWVGLISFDKDEASLREPTLWNDMIRLFYTLDRFHDVVDMLRQEKPLELYLNPAGRWGSILTKDMEPVGEEEGL